MDQSEIARWTRAAELLDQVLELPQSERQKAVTNLGKTHGVTRELESLLEGSSMESVLDDSIENLLQQMPNPQPELNAYKGQIVGNWLLEDEIGRGGMSVVYHARRTGEEFEQHAALKILSVSSLDEAFVVSFIRERQILSDLHHPGIARLIDGGITQDGAPYLVMQHVQGDRIDRWCEQNHCDLKAIAQLIVKLCQAVAYAQRHLVVHQDINPANVLIDEHSQPVLIDFGIAKLLGAVSSEHGLRAFTPEYGAPEQLAGKSISTATDVYGIGKLFLHLAKGQRFDRDLEQILEVATQENPEKRYANARGLGDDLQAWMDKRPVLARTPTLAYRLNRFVVRNFWGVAAASLVFLSLLVGFGTALWQAQIASAQRDVAQMEAERATQATGFLTELFQASDPDRAQGEIATARDLLDQGAFQVRNAMNSTPALKAEMMVLLGDLYRRIGELDAAAPLLQEGLSLADAEGDTRLQVEARRALAIKEMDSGAHEVALALSEQGVQLLEQAGSIPGSLHASLMQPMLFSLAELGRTAEAVERGQAILDLVRASVALPETARYDYLYNVANVMLIAQQTDIAEALLLEAVEMDFEGIDRPSTQISLHTQLAGVLSHKGSLESALAHRYLALDLAEQIYPPEHFARARALSNLGSNLVALGRHQEAEAALSQSLEIYRKIYGDTKHPRVAAAQNNLARALQQADNFAAAEPHMIQVLELAEELFGKDDPRYAIAAGNLGVLYREMGEFDRAETILLENLELKRKIYGPEHFSIGNALLGISELRLRQGKPSAALELSEEALSLFSRIDYQSPPSIIMALNCNARALAALGRIDQARAEFDKALALGEESAADAGRAWPDLLAAHAEFLLSQYDPEAEVSLIRALEVYRKMLGENHPATLRLKSLLEE